MKKWWIAVTVLLLLASQIGVSFAKSETVYFLLDRKGDLQKTIVVNSFVEESGRIEDYGVYENIRNLSGSEKPEVADDRVIFKNVGEGAFFYRGELKDAVNPWKIEIRYFLDGKEVQPEGLTDRSGELEMRIRVSAAEKNAFTDQYAIQMQGVFWSGVQEISVENAGLVAIGSQYTVTSVFLPGREHVVRIRAKIDGLELGSFLFTGVKSSFDLDIDFGETEAKVEDLSGGAEKVLEGLRKLETGSASLTAGMKAYGDGLSKLSSGADSLTQGLKILEDSLNGLGTNMRKLPEGTKGLIDMLGAANANASALLPAAEGLIASPDPGVAGVGYALMQQIQLNAGVLNALTQLYEGEQRAAGAVLEIASGYKKAHDGLQSFIGGVGELNTRYGGLLGGASRLSEGLAQTAEGQSAFVDGVEEAKKNLEDLLAFVQGGSGANPGSYVHPKNTAESVTFVMRTEELRKEKPKKEPLPPLPKKSLLGKFLDLFGVEEK